MIKVIAFSILGVVAIFMAYVAMRPAAFRIARDAEVNAPANVVFALINNLHQFGKWSPYEKLDPAMKKTYGGPESGPGATYAWAGNAKAGEGRMTILESKPAELVTMKLEFIKPFAATNQATFKLEPSGKGTKVSWIMEGQNAFTAKAAGVFINFDKMVGKDFEEGLANLNTVAQANVRDTSH